MSANRKPLALHQLEGTLKPSRHLLTTPKPRPVAPKCPDFLDKEAKAHWRKLAPHLERCGLLTEVDGPAFARYCAAYSLWLKASEELNRDGLTVKGYRNHERKHPALTTLFRCEAVMGPLMQAFGLTPASRARLNVSPEPMDEELERMLDKMLEKVNQPIRTN
jgi:P27 family predicted phage terminase small subunit